MPLPDFLRGQTLAAADLNLLVQAIRSLQEGPLSGTPGFGTPRGFVAALSLAFRNVFMPAKITFVHGADPGPPPLPQLRSEFSYDAEAVWKSGVTLTGVRPDFGSDVLGDDCKVYPALVGDDCIIVRLPQDSGEPSAKLWVLTEKIYRRVCQSPTP